MSAPARRPRCLFLPGMMCDERLFAAQLGAFGDVASCRCAPLDGSDRIETLAVSALAGAAGNGDAPLVLVGLSMGGIVAMECLRAAPERVAAVVLMDTNPLAEGPERRRLRPPQIERALGGELDRILVEEMKPLYLAPENRDDESILSLVLTMARELGPVVFARQSRALMARRDYTATLRAWRGPTLILHGEHDALCPPERHELMHELVEDSELVSIAGAGHLPTLEAPAAVNAELRRFLGALDGSRPDRA